MTHTSPEPPPWIGADLEAQLQHISKSSPALGALTRAAEGIGRLIVLNEAAAVGVELIREYPERVLPLMNRRMGREEGDGQGIWFTNAIHAAATQEVGSGFPTINDQSIVAMWALLEAAVGDFVRHWEALTRKADRKQLASRGPAFTKLLASIERVGFEIEVDPQLHRSLTGFGALRNLIVHQDAKADRQYLQLADAPEVALGDRVRVSTEWVGRHGSFAIFFLAHLGTRAAARLRDR